MPSIGPYEVVGEIGRGAMGRIVKARHVTTGAIRAVKVILDERATPAAIARFEREAQLLARVGGDGVVPVHETGTHNGMLWYAMDFCAGGSLRGALDARGQLSWREAAATIAKLARSIARCHAASVIHRDIKPENVLLDDRGEPRLADFGCARDLSAANLTKTGAVVGTALYMAPEQLAGRRAEAPSDVWALGVLLYELVAAAVPHDAPSWVELSRLVQAGGWTRLHSLDAANPASLDAVLERALARDPAARPTAEALAADLDALLAREGEERPLRSRAILLTMLVVSVIFAASAAAWRSRRPLEPARSVAVVATAATPPAPPRAARREPLRWRLAAGDRRSIRYAHRRFVKSSSGVIDSEVELELAWVVERAEPGRASVRSTIERLAIKRTMPPARAGRNALEGTLDFDSSRLSDMEAPLGAAIGASFSFDLHPDTGAVTSFSGVAAIQRRVNDAAGPSRLRYLVLDLASERALQECLDPLLHVLPAGGEVPGTPWYIELPETSTGPTGQIRPALSAPATVAPSGGAFTVSWSGLVETGGRRRSLHGSATFGARGMLSSKQHDEVAAPDYDLTTDLELTDTTP